MARIPQVTRTIQTTKANVMCLDVANEQPVTMEVILPRVYKDEKAMMKVAHILLDSATIKPIHIVSSEVQETLYGMSEADFIKYAEILPPRNINKEA